MSNKILASRYELIEKIGEGGMAVVYKSKDRLLNRFVAIKILKPEYVKDAKFIESFRRESQAAASLSHANIVNVFDVGKEGNIYYIVMEMIDGEVLSDIIKREGPLPQDKALSFAKQIAAGLGIAHKNHIIHRDVKPHNILITPDGIAKITDFGIAKAVNSATIVNNTGVIMGSVHYFSPEQARGGYVDEKSDLYSLGIVLYEMLTGKVPFDADNPVSVAIMQINNSLLPPSELRSDIAPDLEAVILKATEKLQINRYKSTDDMLNALDKIRLKSRATEKVMLNGTETIAGIDRRAAMTFTIKEEDNNKMKDKKNSSGAKSKKSFKWNKIKIAAIILALLCAIPASQFVLALVSGGFNAKEVKVPDVVGMTVAEAEKAITDLGLRSEIGLELYDSNNAAGSIMSQDPAANMSVKEGYLIKLNVSKGTKEGTIPNLTNKQLNDALFTLENYGFVKGNVTVESSELPKDFVIRQSPAPGTAASKGAAVDLVISDGLKAAKIIMPNLLGMDIELAKQELLKMGLTLGDITYENNSIYALNTIMNQAVTAGTEISRDTPILLTVSKGPGTSSGTVSLTIPYDDAQNEVFYLDVYMGATPVVQDQSRNKSAGSENLTLTGEGVVNVQVFFDDLIIMDMMVDFGTGEIF